MSCVCRSWNTSCVFTAQQKIYYKQTAIWICLLLIFVCQSFFLWNMYWENMLFHHKCFWSQFWFWFLCWFYLNIKIFQLSLLLLLLLLLLSSLLLLFLFLLLSLFIVIFILSCLSLLLLCVLWYVVHFVWFFLLNSHLIDSFSSLFLASSHDFRSSWSEEKFSTLSDWISIKYIN